MNGKFTSPEGEQLDTLEEVFEHAFPDSYQRGMRRERPYEGQQPKRAATEISGITMRDLRDCFIRACCQSAGGGISEKGDKLYAESEKGPEALLSENDIFDLPWDDMDPIAIAQNLGCEVEKLMGVYPNFVDGEIAVPIFGQEEE